MEVLTNNRVDFSRTFSEAMATGVKNAPSLIGCLLLWILTLWIPYLNVGTTIAITLLPLEMAEGKVISPICIFDAKYRRYMGEYLIASVLMGLATLIAFYFLIVPGIVLSIAWCLTYYFMFDRNMNPMQAIKASNDATYGSKLTIFAVNLVFAIGAILAGGVVIALISMLGSTFLTIVALIVIVIVLLPINIAIRASIWNQLKENVR